SSLEIDHQLEFDRLKDRQVGRLLALEHPAGVDPGLPIGIEQVGSVAHQTAGIDVRPPWVNSRDRVMCRQHDEHGWLVKNVSAPTRSAPARSRIKAAKAGSVSCSVLALRIRTCWPMARAAFCISRDWVSACALLGFTSMAINVEPGTSSRSSSSRFASSSTPIIAMPVTFPSGRLRLATRPSSTG